MSDYSDEQLQEFVARCAPAQEAFRPGSPRSFTEATEIGNLLRADGHWKEAAVFFGIAYQINKQSKHVLLARLICCARGANSVSVTELRELELLDLDFARYVRAVIIHHANPGDSRSALDCLGNSFEGFYSGSEVDWLFLDLYSQHIVARETEALPNNIPNVLYFYWDRNPPAEVIENLNYHKSLGRFRVEIYDRERAIDFLSARYGASTKRTFLELRHPSEESDFLRFHLIYADGGYYLDTDDQIISLSSFDRELANVEDAVFIRSGSGPIHSAFFGAVRGSPIIEEALSTLIYNCLYEPRLSMWLKTGPGPITRSLVRWRYRRLYLGQVLPSHVILPQESFPRIFRAVDMSYRADARDWRVFEAAKNE